MDAPVYVKEAIKRIDPKLRLRWSKEKKSFALERKTDYRGLLPKPVYYRRDGDGIRELLCPEDSERYISYHDGYVPILYTRNVDGRLIYKLHLSDSFRHGRRFVKAIEDAEEGAQIEQERKESELTREMSGEVYDRLQWAHGERMAVGG